MFQFKSAAVQVSTKGDSMTKRLSGVAVLLVLFTFLMAGIDFENAYAQSRDIDTGFSFSRDTLPFENTPQLLSTIQQQYPQLLWLVSPLTSLLQAVFRTGGACIGMVSLAKYVFDRNLGPLRTRCTPTSCALPIDFYQTYAGLISLLVQFLGTFTNAPAEMDKIRASLQRGSPQVLVLKGTRDSDGSSGAHAVLAYRIAASGDNLDKVYIYDPNESDFPYSLHYIRSQGSFSPYRNWGYTFTTVLVMPGL